MSRTKLGLLASLLFLSMSASVVAEYRSNGLISPVEARRFGLERAWFTQVQMDSARGTLTDLSYFVSAKQSQAIFEVQYEGRTRAFSNFCRTLSSVTRW